MIFMQACDWWSVGVIFYEMIIGAPPFYSKSKEETQCKIINWREYLSIPDKVRINKVDRPISEEAKSLIVGFLADEDQRLGKNGAAEIKRHPFFNGM